MSYSVRIDQERFTPYEDIENLTEQMLLNNNELFKKSEQFLYWVKDMSTLEMNEDETIEMFKESSACDELVRGLKSPLYYWDLLSFEPSEDRIELAYKLAPNCSVMYVEPLDSHFIALTGGGMDMNDTIELAYYILQGKSPVKASGFYTIGKVGEDVLKKCREAGSLILQCEMDSFIQEAKEKLLVCSKKNNEE